MNPSDSIIDEDIEPWYFDERLWKVWNTETDSDLEEELSD